MNKRGETILTSFRHSNAYARMIVSSPLSFLKHFYDPGSVENCFSDDEIEKSAGEAMNMDTLEIITEEANPMATAMNQEGYGGLDEGDITKLKASSAPGTSNQTVQSPTSITIVDIPAHLKSYVRTKQNSSRSVDFNAKDYGSVSDARSVHSNAESTLGDSKTLNQQYLKDLTRDITAQILTHLHQGGHISSPSVPSTVATSQSSSVRFPPTEQDGSHGH